MVEFFSEDRLTQRDFGASGLHVYTHPSRPSTQELVVFVHGFGGSGYGTWREIPTAILQHEAEPRSVAVYDYISGGRRSLLDSPSIQSAVEHLVDELGDLPFKRVTLVGHSLGGVISMSAVREVFDRTTASTALLDSLTAVFTLASPLAGTKLLPFGIIPIRERGALAIHTELQRANHKFFKNRVRINVDGEGAQPLWIPVFSASATGDRFVDPLSSSLLSVPSQCRTFRGGHSAFLKDSAVANWMLSCLQQVSDARRRAILEPSRQMERLRAAFRGDSRFGEWVDAYQSALTEFSLREDMPTEDMSGQESGQALDLLVRVLPAPDVDSTAARSAVASDATLQRQGATRALGVSPFGEDPAAAVLAVREQLDGFSNQWVTGSTSESELQREVVQWLGRVNRLAPPIRPSLRTDTRNRRLTELPDEEGL